jgi:hypothetical protein
MNIRIIGGAAAAIVGIGLLVGGPAQADTKHDSNSLHKLGNAIQYPIRKSTENLSVDIHRGENRKSVESMRPQKAEAVVIPNGKKFVIHHRGTVYAHRRRHHTYSHR